MPNLGPVELGFILIVVLLIFGAGRLPEVGRSLGRTIVEFRHGISDNEQKTTMAGSPAQATYELPATTQTQQGQEPGNLG